MKAAVYIALAFGLAPAQVTVLRYVGVAGVGPDLCLVTACLVGFLGGEIEGLLMGVVLGFVQQLFSAGQAWGNVLIKGAIGLLAGVIGRHVTNATPVTVAKALAGLSALAGVCTMLLTQAGAGWERHWMTAQYVLAPEMLWNIAIGVGAYWLLVARARRDDTNQSRLAGLVR